MLNLSRNAPRFDHREVLARQRTAWASGDYAVAGNALQIVSEELCETVNLCQDERVLDVAAGNFHASLAAARRWCDVTATDHASDLSNRSPQRAEALSNGVRFVDADAEALPFRAGVFDTVVSGLVFCSVPDPARGLAEVRRVLKPDGALRMLEHVRASGGWKARMQDRWQPLWTRITGGCRWNRDTEGTVARAGFRIDAADRRARGDLRRFVARPAP